MVNYESNITLTKMLEFMDSGQPFSIGFRTCNLQKDTGGEYIFLDKVVKHSHQTKEQRKKMQPEGFKKVVKRNPNHFENSTRNIRRIDNGDIITVHIRLIRMFNGKIVM